jgi:signal transduction histidine kinase
LASIDFGLKSPRAAGAPSAAWVRNGLVSVAFVFAYLGINVVTSSRQFEVSGITLWSPDNGLSLLLLMESTYFAPVVLAGAVFVDVFISDVGHDVYVVLASELVLTWGYLVIAIILRDAFRFNTRSNSYANMIAVLAVVPASAAVTSMLYCGVLYVSGALPLDRIYVAGRDFWIGDSVGMIIVLPAATAVHDIVANRRWRRLFTANQLVPAAATGACMAAMVFISVSDVRDRYLFDLLFLPLLWVGINYGYNAVAMALLATQLMLIAALTYFHVGDSDFGIFQTLMFILAATGQLLGAVITEREHATRLLQKQQSELARVSAQATTGAMAVTFAHEISQPLSSLSSYVHGARRMLDAGHPNAAISSVLAKAEAEARKTRRVIERIRDFVASGRLERENVDLAQLARTIALLNRADARARGVDLAVETATALPPVSVDRIAIEQALNNLVANAIDSAAARGDGQGHVAIAAGREGETLRLQVDDNGAGVASGIAEHLFEVFQTTKPKGMGLGLSLAREIAQRHGGRVGWRPLEPQGARFHIELPIHAPKTD